MENSFVYAVNLTSMSDVKTIEKLLIEFGVKDSTNRPMWYALKNKDSKTGETQAAAFLYMFPELKDSAPSYFFDAGYRICEKGYYDCSISQFASLIQLVKTIRDATTKELTDDFWK